MTYASDHRMPGRPNLSARPGVIGETRGVIKASLAESRTLTCD
ncbi:hypothetical protein [Streptomyces parvulus]